MSDELMEIFTECIEAIEAGRLTVGECLAKYVQYRFELEPMLLAATELRALPPATPSPAFRAAVSQRLMARMPAPALNGTAPVPAGTSIPLSERLLMAMQTVAQGWPFSSRSTWAVSLSVVAFFFLLGGLLLSSGLSSANTLNRNNLLPEEDRMATVEVLEGSVEVMAANGKWQPVSKFATVSAGMRVRTGDFSSAKLTYADGSSRDIGPNMEFTVEGQNNSAGFQPLGPSPTPTATMVITPTPTMTPTMVITPTPTMRPTMVITPTPTMTPTMVITPTPTMTPTMVITPTPTMTPTMVITPTPTMGVTPTPTPGITPTPTPGQEMVTICHKPGTPAEKTMTLPAPAIPAHLAHGDTLGPCTDIPPSPTVPGPTPTVPGPTPTVPGPSPTPGNGGMVTICHKPGTPAEQTLTIPEVALSAHLAHGDTMGACE